jgi:hypothetical protein
MTNLLLLLLALPLSAATPRFPDWDCKVPKKLKGIELSAELLCRVRWIEEAQDAFEDNTATMTSVDVDKFVGERAKTEAVLIKLFQWVGGLKEPPPGDLAPTGASWLHGTCPTAAVIIPPHKYVRELTCILMRLYAMVERPGRAGVHPVLFEGERERALSILQKLWKWTESASWPAAETPRGGK